MNHSVVSNNKKTVGVVLALFFFVAFFYLRSPLKYAKYNLLMLEWTRALPWPSSTKRWPLERQTIDRNALEKTQRQLGDICDDRIDSYRVRQFEPCRLVGRVQGVSASYRSDIVLQEIVQATSGTPEPIVAVFMGDVAFALGDIETAAAIWREYLPNDDLLWRADAIARAGRYKLAEQFLVDMEQWEDGLTRAQLRRLATLLARLATSYSADRDFAQAAYYWQLAIDTIPKPNYYRGLGVSLAQEQRWQEAIVALGTAIVLEPDEPDHLLALAFVYRLMGRDDQAILVARAALQIAPNNQRALRFLNEIQR